MSFSGWQALGGKIIGSPCIQVWNGVHDDLIGDIADSWSVFGRGLDNHLWRFRPGEGWMLWDNTLKLESGPTVDGHLRGDEGFQRDIAVIADGGATFAKPDGVNDASAAWLHLGGKSLGEPAILSGICVFVRGLDKHLWTHEFGWEWGPVDKGDTLTLLSAPTVAVIDMSESSGGPFPFPKSTEIWWEAMIAASGIAPGKKVDSIWTRHYNQKTGRWDDKWFDRAGRCYGAPAVVCADGGFALFVWGLDGYLWSDWRGKWRAVNHDMKIASAPSVAFGMDVMHIVVRGIDNAVYHATWDGV